MAWRTWSKRLFVQNGFLLLLPVFLLFIIIFLIILLLLPLTPTNVVRLPVRALRSTEVLRSRSRVNQQPLSLSTHSGNRHSIPAKTFGDAANNQNKHKRKGTTSKSKAAPGADRPRTSRRPPVPEFIVNTQSKTRIKVRNHGAVVRETAQTTIHLERTESLPQIPSSTKTADRKVATLRHSRQTSGRRAEHSQDVAKHSGKSDKAGKQQAANKPSRNLKKHQISSEDLSDRKTKPEPVDRKMTLTKLQTAVKKDGGDWCQSIAERRFSGSDHRSVRTSSDLSSVPWLSDDDVHKMKLLADWDVISKSRVPAHGQVLQVGLDGPAPQHTLQQTSTLHHRPTHSERCHQGRCALIKRTDDWFEVFAFHLDRVLGLNRSLPMVLRTFHSDILPYRYLSGTPRPVVWWDPDIQHLTDSNNDQNSVPLSWIQYQELLRVHCGTDADLWSAPCVGVQHSEWGRLALFDFLLQVNDRLDRNCCGFTPDPDDICVENLLHHKCHNARDLLLVHILVRRAEPNRLVFIDNAGRPHQAADNLDFRLIEGIDEFPETAVSVLQSGCLENLLLRSLHTDKIFWDSRGGSNGLKVLIRTVEQRGKILLRYIKDKKLRLNRDL